MKRVLPVAFLFVFVTQVNAQQGFSVAPKPDWIVPVTYSEQVSDTANAGGCYDILLNRQFNPEKQEVFLEYIVKVISEAGLSSASTIKESFDPSFQKMDFHEVKVIRNGKEIDKLVRKDFSLLQREEDLSRQMYDGTLTAVLELKGIKAGDIVKYSFTTRGSNPVFKNHFFRTLYFNFSTPTGKVFYQICTSPHRRLYFQNREQDIKPVEGSLKQYKTFTWSLENIPAFLSDDSAPGWYDPYNRVEITDFASWKDLSAWANDLFKINMRQSPALKGFIDSLKAIDNEEARILAAIRSIQDKVRYLSLSNGISGYQPHTPSEVFENKYGDCKDKSVLLSQVLNATGVRSNPVLVSTTDGKTLSHRSPSPWLFDHCIVRLEYMDSSYWIDPTISFQRGRLKKTDFPPYHNGLVVGTAEDSLTSIPLHSSPRSTLIKEDYFADEFGTGARFEVLTEYRGSDADATRDFWLTTAPAEIDKQYLNFYADEYPNISLATSATFEDDTINNVFTTRERYKIEEFWSYDSITGEKVGRTYARYVSTYLYKPRTKIRRAPYAITLGRDVKQVVKIHVPEPVDVDNYQKTIRLPGMLFKTLTVYSDLVVRLDYSLVTTEDHVPSERIDEYIKGIDRIYDELSFRITYGSSSSSSQFVDNWRVPIMVLVIGLALFFVYWRRQRR